MSYGSHVHGTETTDSDVAVGFEGSVPASGRLDRRVALVDALGTDHVDVADLDGIRPEVGLAALETGRVLLGDRDTHEGLADATRRKTNATGACLTELQARELEKGAHLRAEHVDEHEIDAPDGRLERITKTDGETYSRLPERADHLERGGDVELAHGDLLPIQQLARMDDDMLRSAANALPTRLAAKLWQARTDSSVGDNPWETGGAGINEYVTASDLRHWIRRQEAGVSDTYAKKLVSRVVDAMLDLSTHRVAVRRRTERKNGLEYTERRLVLPEDVDVPGETGGNQSR